MGFRNHPHGIEPLVKIGEKSLGRVRGNANFENSDSHPFFSRDAVICDLAWAKILPHVNDRPTTGLMQWYSKPHGRTDVQSKVSASKFSATVVSAAVTSWRFSWVAKTGDEEKWGLGLHKLNVENPLNVPQNKYIYHIWGVMHRLRFFLLLTCTKWMPWCHMGGAELLLWRTAGVLTLWWVSPGEIVHVGTGFHIQSM